MTGTALFMHSSDKPTQCGLRASLSQRWMIPFRERSHYSEECDRKSLHYRVMMNRECRWRWLDKFPKALLVQGTRKSARAILTARSDNQASLGEFRGRFPHEGGVAS